MPNAHHPPLRDMKATDNTPKADVRERVEQVFGDARDRIEDVEARAKRLLTEYATIVWEADAATFDCTFISVSAEKILGFSREQWTGTPGFWLDTVHEPDRDEAIANCALCTGRGRGHNFSYRSRTRGRDLRRIFNVVRAVRGPKGFTVRLRGIMFDVTDDDEFLTVESPLHQIRNQASEKTTDP